MSMKQFVLCTAGDDSYCHFAACTQLISWCRLQVN